MGADFELHDNTDKEIELRDAEARKAETDEQEAPVSERDRRLAELAEQRAEEMRGDQPEEPEPVKPPPQYLIERDGQTFVRAKVYGKETEIPFDEAIKRLQKDVAADQRLQEVAQMEAQIKARDERSRQVQQALSQHIEQLQQQAKTATPAEKEQIEQQVDDLADIDAAMETLYDGDPKQAAAALKKALQKMQTGRQTPTPQIDENAIVTKAAQLMQAQAQEQARRVSEQQRAAEIESARQFFDDEYSEIANDPRLRAYADRETELILSENPALPPREIVKMAGDRIRQMLTPNSVDRKARKAGRSQPITGRAGSSALPTPEAPAPTTKDVIAEMRKQRGQA